MRRVVIGVGGIVCVDSGIVLVRLTYSRHCGKYMFPGGKVEQGETLEGALVREVLEETGIEAVPEGIVAVRHRVDPDELNTYLVFQMHHVAGAPQVVSREADDVRVFGADDLRQARDSCVPLVPQIALPVLDGKCVQLSADSGYKPLSPYDEQSFRVYGPTESVT